MRRDYAMEAEKQFNGKAVNKDVNFDKDLIPHLTGKSSKLFENLKRRQLITEKKFLSISILSFRKLVTYGSCICCLKSTSNYQMYPEDQALQIVGRLKGI